MKKYAKTETLKRGSNHDDEIHPPSSPGCAGDEVRHPSSGAKKLGSLGFIAQSSLLPEHSHRFPT